MLACGRLAAQTESGSRDPGAWNSLRAFELVSRARALRHAAATDTAFRDYRADARGFVYFFLDRPDTEEHTLVKADQVALEVYWRSPSFTRQRIVGLRDEKVLPTNIQYHLDHLTVVQDDFNDQIRLGDGDEVADVTHPVAPGAERVYDYRLTDSLTVAYAGTADTIRVYELQVRPKDLDAPGFVGSVYVDRASAAIVRMRFTFTPASYVDPYLDYIRISLDNSLWMGRYWLPYRQEAELRRELPQLDFLAGSVIRGRFEIRGYEFNTDPPEDFFRTRRVTAVPEDQRRSFEFEEPLFADLDEEGLADRPAIEDIRRQAQEMISDRYMSGLSRLRLHLPSASSAYRFNRAEGSFVGVGATLRSGATWTLRGHGGYAFGRERPSATLSLERDGGLEVELQAYLNRMADIGPHPGATGVVNSLGGLLAQEDWTDPYVTRGVRSALRHSESGRSLTLVAERQSSASLVVTQEHGTFRPVRPVEAGDLFLLELAQPLGQGPRPELGMGAEIRLAGATFEGRTWGRITTSLGWVRAGAWRDLGLAAHLDAGLVSSDAPPQALFLLGGRETLLGHRYRGFVGDSYWLLRLEGSRAVWEPWVTLRALASAGQAELHRGDVPPGWQDADPEAGVLVSLGGGVALLWDVLHLDVARGVDGGEWDVAFSVAHRFRSWL